MSFQISSEKIGNPLLIELLKTITDCFEGIGLPFYVIGATARDIIMRQLVDTASARRTQDLDIAIAIPDWGKFEEASDVLIVAGLRKDPRQHQRFYLGSYELDVVPYGGVAKEDDRIYWPPEEDIAMSVKGFEEVLRDAITVNIDGEFDIKIASLHGLFLLKFNAWLDRYHRTAKDAEDMNFILENYFEANIDRKFHTEVYDRDDFDKYLVGGIWLAYDLLPLLNTGELLAYYADAIRQEIDKAEASPLINQILEHQTRQSYDLVMKTWREIANILREE
jgi:predicted nucleotidyltransferase